MAENFKAGDIVQLKSGGPKMTVTQVGPDPIVGSIRVWCSWFVATKSMKEMFVPAALEKVE
jgi:uncharacterized protein YodC (DUF2158 family)